MKQVNDERSVKEPIFTLLQLNPTFLVILTLVLWKDVQRGTFGLKKCVVLSVLPDF